jgi:tRNA-uridine 2-sulfurtransferase
MKKVVLGMSGGVDSSVAALLLKKQGYEVYGYFMSCKSKGKPMWLSSIDWKEDEKILRKICRKVGVKKLIVADCEQGYEKKIIGPMFDEYKIGRTPNPDILCNNIGKFPNLLKIMKEIGAEFIATGHYARINKTRKGIELLRGKDKKKDQSYFLCGLSKEILEKCLFPIGDFTKEEIRAIAKRNKFPNWDKRGSRGICYLGKIDMKKFMKQRIVEMNGEMLSPEGDIIGTHPGSVFFTIGERVTDSKGFRFNKKFRRSYSGKKFYVAEKLSGNRIVIASKGDKSLLRKKVFLSDFKFIGEEVKTGLTARIRHLGEFNSGKLKKEKTRWTFAFDKGQEGVAEGQFIVLYKGEIVVGCGEIRFN